MSYGFVPLNASWNGSRYVVGYAASGSFRVQALSQMGEVTPPVDLPAEPWDDLGFIDLDRAAGTAVGVAFPTVIDRATSTFAIRFALVDCP